MAQSLTHLLGEVRACTTCAEYLVDGVRPVVQVGSAARIVIIGQAPGRKVHESGVPWDDPSGVRLRTWLGLTNEQVYDPDIVAIIPMGFCFPGNGKSGDLPPRPECAPQWHDRLLEQLPANRLEVIIGRYAQDRYIDTNATTLTEVVADWRSHLPDRIVMPHPSPRNRRWLSQNPWFEEETVPAIQQRVHEVVRANESD